MSDPIQIEVKDFEPGPNLEAYLFEEFEGVLSMAPHGARVHALIELNAEKQIHAVIKLDIGTNRYITNFTDSDIMKCMLKVFGKMRSDISRWRRDRALKGNMKRQNEFEALQLEKKKAKYKSDGGGDGENEDGDGSKKNTG